MPRSTLFDVFPGRWMRPLKIFQDQRALHRNCQPEAFRSSPLGRLCGERKEGGLPAAVSGIRPMRHRRLQGFWSAGLWSLNRRWQAVSTEVEEWRRPVVEKPAVVRRPVTCGWRCFAVPVILSGLAPMGEAGNVVPRFRYQHYRHRQFDEAIPVAGATLTMRPTCSGMNIHLDLCCNGRRRKAKKITNLGSGPGQNHRSLWTATHDRK